MSGLQGFGQALQAAVNFTFSDAVLVQIGAGAPVDHGNGSFTNADVETPVRAKLDNKRSYSPDRGTYTETRILILAGTLTKGPERGNALQFGTAFDVNQPHYKLGDVITDGLASHYTCGVING